MQNSRDRISVRLKLGETIQDALTPPTSNIVPCCLHGQGVLALEENLR